MNRMIGSISRARRVLSAGFLLAWIVAAAPGAPGETCVECHQDWFESKQAEPVSHTVFRDGDCEDCHEPHGPANVLSLKDDTNGLCFECHERTQEETEDKYHHAPVRDGVCWMCHDPHASRFDRLLKTEERTLCLDCHKAMADRMANEQLHWPAQEGCDACHVPHGSDIPALLRGRPTQLCDGCHGTDPSAMGEIHRGIVPSSTACLDCHNPHSSPWDHMFLRSVHVPVLDGKCSECHTGGLEAGAANDLCLRCHTGMETAEDTHEPVRDAECADCHRSHTSPYRALLRRPEIDICLDCHDEVEEDLQRTYRHEVFQRGDCGACHNVHKAPETGLLPRSPDEICAKCHKLGEEGRLPAGHPAVDETACLGCHDPHSSNREALLRNGSGGK